MYTDIIQKQLEVKTSSVYLYGFKFNEELICTLRKLININDSSSIIEFWNSRNFSIEKKYTFTLQNLYHNKTNSKFMNLNNNDNIIFGHKLFFLYIFF